MYPAWGRGMTETLSSTLGNNSTDRTLHFKQPAAKMNGAGCACDMLLWHVSFHFHFHFISFLPHLAPGASKTHSPSKNTYTVQQCAFPTVPLPGGSLAPPKTASEPGGKVVALPFRPSKRGSRQASQRQVPHHACPVRLVPCSVAGCHRQAACVLPQTTRSGSEGTHRHVGMPGDAQVGPHRGHLPATQMCNVVDECG